MKRMIVAPLRAGHTEKAVAAAGALLAAAALILLIVPSAHAAPGETDTGSTNAHVAVPAAISLTGLTADFTLTGLPGATVTGLEAVSFTVETNDLAGYIVTVQSATPAMVPAIETNPDSIPIGTLTIRESGSVPYSPLNNTATVTVHSQSTRSAEGGDELSDDFRIVIPFVNEETYTATLNYVATTL